MLGLELSKKYFSEYGKRMIEEKFPEYSGKIAAGLVGQGSERYGFDDGVSHDHDFCCGFQIFVDTETEREIGFELSAEYRRLPKEFMGFSAKEKQKSRNGYGVVTYDEFFCPLLGADYGNLSDFDYLRIPQNYFADAVNGEIFYDPSGAFAEIYNKIKFGMSRDVCLKKISANIAAMAQSGQYNYARCLSHGEDGAAVMALCEFVRHACAVIYLANGKFMPYYKWRLRGLAELEIMGGLAPSLEFILTASNDPETQAVKSEITEDICAETVKWLQSEGLSSSNGDFLEEHASEILKRIKKSEIRNLHILDGAD